MQEKVTVITAIRNRDAWRIRTMVESIRSTGADPLFHIVDYGSSNQYKYEYETICKELKIKYTYMYAEGLPWNKCRALNYGIKVATTPIIVTSDVDMIHEGNSIQWCLDHYNKNEFYQIETYWLPKNGKREKAAYKGRGTEGPFTLFSKEQWETIHGYDESFLYWGPEDVDWALRLRLEGYKQIWLPDQYKIFHQWHKSLSSEKMKPSITPFISAVELFSNTLSKNNTDINKLGTYISKEMRPILKNIELNNYTIHSYPHNYFTATITIIELKELLEKEKCVKLEISPRIKKRPLVFLYTFLKVIFKPVTFLTGTQFSYNYNQNFDFIFNYLQIMMNNGLIDFFIEPNLSSIYFLWR